MSDKPAPYETLADHIIAVRAVHCGECDRVDPAPFAVDDRAAAVEFERAGWTVAEATIGGLGAWCPGCTRKRQGFDPDCPCRACADPDPVLPRMQVCPACGNKRCPAAQDHRRYVCTGSNEPGQPLTPLPGVAS